MTLHKFTGDATMAGVNLERCSDAQEHALGLVVSGIASDGQAAKYRYVKFLDAVAYVLGHVVTPASASAWSVTNDRSGGSALANLFPVGVVFQTVVPTQNQYGFVQISGIAKVMIGSGSVIAGDTLKVCADSDDDGQAEEGVNGTDENIVGVALDTIADTAVGLVMLAIRGGA